MSDKLTNAQQDKALAIVAKWLGPKMGYDGPAPTGVEAQRNAEGPVLVRDWDWPESGATPTILLEGGPYEWSIDAGAECREAMSAIGVFCEPYNGFALCLYPA